MIKEGVQKGKIPPCRIGYLISVSNRDTNKSRVPNTFWTPSFVLYIKFTNQTYRSVYEFPEFAEYGKLISFAFVIVVATTDDLGIDIETL